MVYSTDSQHFTFSQNLLLCSTILVHHVLPYVIVVPQGMSCEGWMVLFKREPTVASVSSHVLPYMCDRNRRKGQLHSNGDVWGWTLSMQRLDAWMPFLYVNGNVCGRFRECWHERFNYTVIFCRYTNYALLGTVNKTNSFRLAIIGSNEYVLCHRR